MKILKNVCNILCFLAIGIVWVELLTSFGDTSLEKTIYLFSEFYLGGYFLTYFIILLSKKGDEIN